MIVLLIVCFLLFSVAIAASLQEFVEVKMYWRKERDVPKMLERIARREIRAHSDYWGGTR
jgi:hypothetical protein